VQSREDLKKEIRVPQRRMILSVSGGILKFNTRFTSVISKKLTGASLSPGKFATKLA
jgi:hypothetical protein